MTIDYNLVYEPQELAAVGLESRNGTIKTFNGTGYMRNYLCEISRQFITDICDPDKRILEVGCGIGAVVKALVTYGYINITAVDIEKRHLETADQLIKQTLLSFPECSLIWICDKLPELSLLNDQTFDSILCAQALHYMNPEQFEKALLRMSELLSPGGKLYITIGSPYIDVYQGFAEEYEKRMKAGNRFPGYMDDVRKYHPNGVNHNPGSFLFFDPVALQDRVIEYGLRVVDVKLMNDREKPKYQTGLVAEKVA